MEMGKSYSDVKLSVKRHMKESPISDRNSFSGKLVHMGSQRRILAELSDQGVTDEEQANVALKAIETLNSAGDSFSGGLYQWLDRGDKEKGMVELDSALAEVVAAIVVLRNL